MTNTRKALYVTGAVGIAAFAYWLFKPTEVKAEVIEAANALKEASDTGVVLLSDGERNNIIDAFNSGVNALGNPIGLSPEARDASADRLADSVSGFRGGGIGRIAPSMRREDNRVTNTSAVILSSLTDLSRPVPTTSERLGGRGIPGASF